MAKKQKRNQRTEKCDERMTDRHNTKLEDRNDCRRDEIRRQSAVNRCDDDDCCK